MVLLLVTGRFTAANCRSFHSQFSDSIGHFRATNKLFIAKPCLMHMHIIYIHVDKSTHVKLVLREKMNNGYIVIILFRKKLCQPPVSLVVDYGFFLTALFLYGKVCVYLAVLKAILSFYYIPLTIISIKAIEYLLNQVSVVTHIPLYIYIRLCLFVNSHSIKLIVNAV